MLQKKGEEHKHVKGRDMMLHYTVLIDIILRVEHDPESVSEHQVGLFAEAQDTPYISFCDTLPVDCFRYTQTLELDIQWCLMVARVR